MSESKEGLNNALNSKETICQAKACQQQEIKTLPKPINDVKGYEDEKDMSLRRFNEMGSLQTTQPVSEATSKHVSREICEPEEPHRIIPAAISLGPDLCQHEEDELERRLADITFDAPYKGVTGAKVYDIDADGHCLFRSLAHQLSLYLPFEAPFSGTTPDYITLRQACRREILSNSHEYAPFLLNDEGNLLTPEEVRDYAEKIAYCGSSPFWGSHLEVSIVSKLFQRPITIIGSDFNVTVGEGIAERSKSKLLISFHQHLYSSEHYNSLVPVSFLTGQQS